MAILPLYATNLLYQDNYYQKYMANQRISALTAAAAALGADQIPVNEAGSTKKVTIDQLSTLVTGGPTATVWTPWTPTISGGTVAGAGTYTSQTGKYCQIGKVLFFYGQVVWTAHTGSGSLIFNLPATSTVSTPLTIGYFENITTGGALQRVCRTTDGTTKAIFTLLQDAAGESTIGLDTAGGMYISGFYEVA